MSGIVNKIKDALHKDHDSSSTTHSSTTGTHGTTGTHTTGTHGTTATHTTGTHATGTHGTTGSHGTTGGYGSTNAGPHDSNLANKADPRVDSDRDGSNRHTTGTHTGTGHNNLTGTTGHSTVSGVTSGRTDHTHVPAAHGTPSGAPYGTPTHGNTTAGPHDSNLANKADPRVDSDRDGSNLHSGTGHSSTTHGTHGTSGLGSSNTYGSTNAGPHNSNAANKVDPRVDSDRDGSNLHGATGHSSGLAGTHGTHSNTHSSTTGSTTTPHNSNVLNKLDPRVDNNTATTHNTHGSNTHSSGLTGNSTHGSNTHSSGLTGNNTYGSSNTAGPHQTDTANRIDPRVDSDRSNTHAGYGQTGTHAGNLSGTTHTGNTHGVSHSNNAGPHDSNLANKADPRVDSDLDGKGNRHGANTTGGVFGASGSHATAGSGTAQNTAGPHNSDLLNKLDPRVDSDRDHSKTLGQDKTHA